MSYYLDSAAADGLIGRLLKEYRIFAPKRFVGQGRFSDTDIIRYAEITALHEAELHERSTYSAKEVVTPINQAIFYFTPDEYRESKGPEDKPILVFLRSCDIHAFEHQDKIYLENGGEADLFYKRVRDRLNFVLIECEKSFDSCFCVSMGSNQTDNYVMAVRPGDNGVSFEVKDQNLLKYFEGSEICEFTPKFVEENPNKVVLPQIPDRETLIALKNHPFWDEYNKRCISCGSCTLACSTCTCFTTRDLSFTEDGDMGERRRITASCQVDALAENFDEMAGGHMFRKTAGARMRYKMLHKFHDYYERFKDSHMCVGCGRCTDHCPEYISMTANIAKMKQAVDEIKAGKAGVM